MGERIDYLDDPAAPEANSVVPSANVIVVNGHSGILMIRRTDNGNWAVPGGGMDLGESITDTAVRETREETGISCEITGLVGIYTSPRHVILYTSNGEARQEFSIRPASRRATAGQQRVGRTAMGCSRRHPGLADAPVDASAHPALSRQTAQALPRLNSEQLFDPPRRSQDLRSGQLNESCDLVTWTVPAADLDKPISRPDIIPVGARRHVAVQERIRQCRIAGGELNSQQRAQFTDLSFKLSARVVGHEANHLRIDIHAAKEPRPIQRVEAGVHQLRGIADVMQPRRSHQLIGQVQSLCNPPGSPTHRPDMPPATRQRSRQPRLSEILRAGDIDHGLDSTQPSEGGRPGARSHRTTLRRHLTCRVGPM